MAALGVTKKPDELGEEVYKYFLEFLNVTKNPSGELKYLEDVKDLARPERSSAFIDFRDIRADYPDLAGVIVNDYYRIAPFLVRAVKQFFEQTCQKGTEMKKEIMVDLNFYDFRCYIRHLRADKIGCLLKISGQVVRTHPVHPELVAGTFRCLECQTVCRNVLQQYKYTLPTVCRNPVCANRTKFELDIRNSKFIDFQKIRIQEVQSELPRGAIPRTVEVILRAECVDRVQPGDRVEVTGTLIVVPDVGQLAVPGVRAETAGKFKQGESNQMEGVRGLRALGVRDLTYRLAFLACHIEATAMRMGTDVGNIGEDVPLEELEKKIGHEQWAQISAMSTDPKLYDNLIQSMFPTIYGNDEVKRGILLMLFGGVGKQTKELTSLRGDINVCIVGDPSTAKSQFLRQITDFVPRAVYTSGKASTAAGLTAAVVKDEESHEFVIEAGALMLADNGVCCIDEFDKMDYKDQVAIHEAMEQQTISITKAGVKATLNARTSILAAANPIGGRYDKTKSLRQNITLSAPIMSRFDLFFVLIDDCDEFTDHDVAQRIVDLHRDIIDSESRKYSIQDVQQYIEFARHFKPKLTSEAKKKLVREYVRMRIADSNSVTKSAWRITVRQLESMIRLSEALARLHCQDEISVRHVTEAIRLIDKSIIRVEQPDLEMNFDEQVEAGLEMQMEVDGIVEPIPPIQKATHVISHEVYQNYADAIVGYLRLQEERFNEGAEPDIHKSDIINWYLENFEPDVDPNELVVKAKCIQKVLDRLATIDHVLQYIRPEGADENEDLAKNPIVVIHPNYVHANDPADILAA